MVCTLWYELKNPLLTSLQAVMKPTRCTGNYILRSLFGLSALLASDKQGKGYAAASFSRSLCRLSLIFLLATAPFGAQAQELPYQDPLNKPALWAQIIQKPLFQPLWEEYRGKKWTQLSPQERVEVKMWQQTAMLLFVQKRNPNNGQNNAAMAQNNQKNQTTTNGSNTNSSTKNNTQSQVKNQTKSPYALRPEHVELLKREEIRTYVREMEEFVMLEPMEVEDLKENLFENFFLIEDYFFEEFKRYGASYVTYKKTHPKGDYSEDQWIEEKENELLNLKKSYIEKEKFGFLEAQLQKQ
ncbi:hypothetical protein [Hugenholtzia roseola]|uniref:hypothetical protein n=1 Tax=Hugenholtzia roseola TaxID=1002 RepID=UPI0003FFCB2D|nr:hypothetical protein [Hugenholtzia roseola]